MNQELLFAELAACLMLLKTDLDMNDDFKVASNAKESHAVVYELGDWMLNQKNSNSTRFNYQYFSIIIYINNEIKKLRYLQIDKFGQTANIS